MKKNKSPISKTDSYEEMGEFWDSHDLTDLNNELKKVNFNVGIKNDKIYCAVDKQISDELQSLANKRGVAPDVLVNLFLQEKLKSLKSKKIN